MNSHQFPAMGTVVEVLLSNPRPELFRLAEEAIKTLEEKWSRFLAQSEIGRLNRARGESLSVSPETRLLLRCAVAAHAATAGAFDPTVADSMLALGYDRPFHRIGQVEPSSPERSFGPEGIEIDDVRGRARLPLGVRFDPGGIGKGLAADLTIEKLLEAGADNVLVNVGGDLRALGHGPCGQGWPVLIDQPGSGAPAVTLMLRDGALATSTTLKRRWSTPRGMVHHIIDPATGANPASEVTVATTVAGAAWWAEAATKPLMIGRKAPANVPWRTVDRYGRVATGGEFLRYAAKAA